MVFFHLIDAENHIWNFVTNNNEKLAAVWAKIICKAGDIYKKDMHHFDKDGRMTAGWYQYGPDGLWYYFSENHNGEYGRLETGWLYDPRYGSWFYLTPETGIMKTGWQEIDGKWYYFALGGDKPAGSMYAAEITPDGYHVNSDGIWVE